MIYVAVPVVLMDVDDGSLTTRCNDCSKPTASECARKIISALGVADGHYSHWAGQVAMAEYARHERNQKYLLKYWQKYK